MRRCAKAPRWAEEGTYEMDVREDRFIHFTPVGRIPEIIESGYLLTDPPYEGFGIVGVQAVSAVWGRLVPGVQYTHLDGNLGAIEFRTPTPPDVGYPEEVIWDQDVRLRDVRELGFEEAKGVLRRTPHAIEEGSVRYV